MHEKSAPQDGERSFTVNDSFSKSDGRMLNYVKLACLYDSIPFKIATSHWALS